MRRSKRITILMIRVAALTALIGTSVLRVAGQQTNGAFRPTIPQIWDEKVIQEMELPLVVPRYSPKPISATYYHKIPVRTIYKSYAIYAPGRAPTGYFERLKTFEPEPAFESSELKNNQDWIDAGEVVFEPPTVYDSHLSPEDVADPNWYAHSGVRLTGNGIMPYAR